jgi:hypothetical protein
VFEVSISIKLHLSFTSDKVYLLINYIWLAEIMIANAAEALGGSQGIRLGSGKKVNAKEPL